MIRWARKLLRKFRAPPRCAACGVFCPDVPVEVFCSHACFKTHQRARRRAKTNRRLRAGNL